MLLLWNYSSPPSKNKTISNLHVHGGCISDVYVCAPKSKTKSFI